MTFGQIFVVILIILIIFNLFQMIQRGQKTNASQRRTDRYQHGPIRGREPPPSNRQWRGKRQQWGNQIDEIGQELEALKRKAESLPSLPAEDFSELDPQERKVKATAVLNRRRGKTVKLTTESGEFKTGVVVTLTAEQVMLRESDKIVRGVPLRDVVRIG